MTAPPSPAAWCCLTFDVVHLLSVSWILIVALICISLASFHAEGLFEKFFLKYLFKSFADFSIDLCVLEICKR